MSSPCAFLLDGHPIPRVIRNPPHATNFTFEQLAENALDHARSADFFSRVADIYGKLEETGIDAAQAEAALVQITIDAQAGDMASAFVLGRAQLEGGNKQIAKDEIRALDWLSRVAEGGYAPAQTLIGWYYTNIAKQAAKALPYLHAAAEQGDTRAQVLFSAAWNSGVPGLLEPDAMQSVRYLRLATDGRTPDTFYKGLAAALLADRYAGGLGVTADPATAIRWNRKALEWDYTGNRVDLAKLLKASNPTQNAEEIKSLLAAASKDGDESAKYFLLDEEWARDLATWKRDAFSIDFWTNRLTYTGSEMRSETHIRSTPGAPNIAPTVYSVKEFWTELKFRNAGGHEQSYKPDSGGRTMVINTGATVIAVYAGVSQADGNANGFAYRFYKPGSTDVGDVRKIDALLGQIGVSQPSAAWFALVAMGLVVLVAGAGFFSLLGLIVAGGAGWVWYRCVTRVSNVRKAVETHLDRIGAWIAQLS